MMYHQIPPLQNTHPFLHVWGSPFHSKLMVTYHACWLVSGYFIEGGVETYTFQQGGH